MTSRRGGGGSGGTQRDQYENTLRNLLSMTQDDFEARVVSTQLEANVSRWVVGNDDHGDGMAREEEATTTTPTARHRLHCCC